MAEERVKLHREMEASFEDKLIAYRKKWVREAKAEGLLKHLEADGNSGEAGCSDVDKASLGPSPLCMDESYIKLIEVQYDDVKALLHEGFASVLEKKDQELASKNNELMTLRSRYQHVMKEINSNLFKSNAKSLLDLKVAMANKILEMSNQYPYFNREQLIAEFVRVENSEAEQQNLSMVDSNASEAKEDLTFLATPDVSGAEVALSVSDTSKILVDKSAGSDEKLPKFEAGASKGEGIDDVVEHTLASLKPKCVASKATSVLNRFVPLKRVSAKSHLSQLGTKSEEKAPLITLDNSDESD